MKNRKNVSLVVLGALLALLFPVFANASLGSKVALFGFGDDKVKVDTEVKIGASAKDDEADEDEDDDSVELRSTSTTKVESRGDKDVPSGIQKKADSDSSGWKYGWLNIFRKWFGWNATTTTDVSLAIKNIEVSSISTSTAVIKWNTSESTTSEVRYATSSSGVASSANVMTNTSLSTSHAVNLSGLSADTKYFFQITVKNSDGNVKSSGILNFETKVAGTVVDTKAPSILFSTVLNVGTDSARIVWVTSEPSNSKVWVTGSSTVSTTGTETAGSGSLSYMHDVKVSGLTSGTKYYYKFESADASANVAVSALGTFTTE